MFEFQITGYATIVLMMVIAAVILFFVLRRAKENAATRKIQPHQMKGIVEIFLGDLLILMSIFLYVAIQKDIEKTFAFFQPIAMMTSEPMKLAVIGLFLAGVIMIIVGGYSIWLNKKNFSSDNL